MYTVLASETTNNLNSMLKPIMDSIQNAVSVSDIVTLLGTAVAFGVPFFLAWMGVRKITKIATSAIKNGSIKA